MSRKPKQSHNRSQKNQEISGDIILIVCEGEKTEPNYFRDLRKEWGIAPIQIQVPQRKSGGSPITLVKKSIKIKKKLEQQQDITIDEIWCVFDHEGSNKDSHYENAVNYARYHGIKTAISAPSFEFWYLLHYEYTTKPMSNANDVIKALKKYIKKYDKSKSYLNDTIYQIETAINNARKVRQHNQNTGSICPTTKVDLLIDKIKSLSRELNL